MSPTIIKKQGELWDTEKLYMAKLASTPHSTSLCNCSYVQNRNCKHAMFFGSVNSFNLITCRRRHVGPLPSRYAELSACVWLPPKNRFRVKGEEFISSPFSDLSSSERTLALRRAWVSLLSFEQSFNRSNEVLLGWTETLSGKKRKCYHKHFNIFKVFKVSKLWLFILFPPPTLQL